MKKIIISDLTMREESKLRDLNLTFKEKLEFARELDRLGVDVIETAPLSGKKADVLLIRTLAALLKSSTLSCTVGRDTASVEETWKAVKDAPRRRLLVNLPVSAPQMEYIVHTKGAKMLEMVKELVSASAALTDEVEFSAEDATRAEPEFLYKVIDTAIAAGAKIITLCDTAGKLLPRELSEFITDVKRNVPALEGVKLSVQCSDELNMATSCVFTSITYGADQIKVASIKGSYPTLESVAHVFHFKGSDLGIACGLDLTGINRAISRMSWLKGGKAKVNMGAAAVTDNDTMSESFLIPQDADQAAVEGYATRLGYELSEEDMIKVYDAYRRIAEHKPVSSMDLDIIIANAANQVPATYTMKNYVINSGNTITSTANIYLEKDGKLLNGLAVGDGPIDAAFRAFENILGHHYELDDFRISSVTEGREAMGKAFIKLRNDGKLFSGQGISTDIIEASILAYAAAVNKIVYEEENV